jgi:hypothetical protein
MTLDLAENCHWDTWNESNTLSVGRVKFFLRQPIAQKSGPHIYGLSIRITGAKKSNVPHSRVLNRKERIHLYRHIRSLDARRLPDYPLHRSEYANRTRETYMANAPSKMIFSDIMLRLIKPYTCSCPNANKYKCQCSVGNMKIEAHRPSSEDNCKKLRTCSGLPTGRYRKVGHHGEISFMATNCPEM